MITVSLEMLCTIVVIALALKNGNFKKMPASVKLTLFFMLVFFPLTITYYLVPFGGLSDGIQDMLRVQNILWACMHWQFTFFYLETAALLRLTFESHDDASFKKVKARKKQLQYVHLAGFATLLLIMVVFIVITESLNTDVKKLMAYWWTIMTVVNLAMTLINLQSMRHIEIQSRSIEHIGVRSNHLMMKLYAIFWIGDTLFTFAQALLWMFITLADDEADPSIQRMYTSIPFFGIFGQLMVVSLDMMVLLSYHRFGRKLTREASQIVTEELQKGITESQVWAAEQRADMYQSLA